MKPSLSALIEQHQENTEKAVETVVADSKYGTVENFLHCHALQKPPIFRILKDIRKNPVVERVSFRKEPLFMIPRPTPTNVLPDSY